MLVQQGIKSDLNNKTAAREIPCKCALTFCYEKNKHKIINREIIFEKVYSKTRKFILKCNSRYTSSMAKYSKTTSVTNLSSFSNNFLKSKVNDTFLMTYIQFQNVISLTVINTQNHAPFKNPLKHFTYSIVFQNKASSPP